MASLNNNSREDYVEEEDRERWWRRQRRQAGVAEPGAEEGGYGAADRMIRGPKEHTHDDVMDASAAASSSQLSSSPSSSSSSGAGRTGASGGSRRRRRRVDDVVRESTTSPTSKKKSRAGTDDDGGVDDDATAGYNDTIETTDDDDADDSDDADDDIYDDGGGVISSEVEVGDTPQTTTWVRPKKQSRVRPTRKRIRRIPTTKTVPNVPPFLREVRSHLDTLLSQINDLRDILFDDAKARSISPPGLPETPYQTVWRLELDAFVGKFGKDIHATLPYFPWENITPGMPTSNPMVSLDLPSAFVDTTAITTTEGAGSCGGGGREYGTMESTAGTTSGTRPGTMKPLILGTKSPVGLVLPSLGVGRVWGSRLPSSGKQQEGRETDDDEEEERQLDPTAPGTDNVMTSTRSKSNPEEDAEHCGGEVGTTSGMTPSDEEMTKGRRPSPNSRDGHHPSISASEERESDDDNYDIRHDAAAPNDDDWTPSSPSRPVATGRGPLTSSSDPTTTTTSSSIDPLHPDLLGESFHVNFVKLRAFHAEHGHFNVPTTFHAKNPMITKEMVDLGMWTSRQRWCYHKYLEGHRNVQMNAQRIDALDSIGFNWVLRKGVWYDSLDELKFYMACHDGSTQVKPSENKKLCRWVHNQRMFYQRRLAGKSRGLSDERVRALNEIGFQWVMGALRGDKKNRTRSAASADEATSDNMERGGSDDDDDYEQQSKERARDGRYGVVATDEIDEVAFD